MSYEELEPLFNTAAKKVGTRIAATLTLKVMLDNGLALNDDITSFINKGKEDSNQTLKLIANEIYNLY